MTAEEDAALVEALDLEGSPPAGGIIRMAGPTVDGWRMVSLWDSDADYERSVIRATVPGGVVASARKSGSGGAAP
jgi:hypothetical protein